MTTIIIYDYELLPVDGAAGCLVADGVGQAQDVVLRTGAFGNVDDVAEQHGHVVTLWSGALVGAKVAPVLALPWLTAR